MKKYAAIILCILAVFAFAAIALGDSMPVNSVFTLEPMFDANDPVLIWDSVGFSIHSDTVRNSTVLFFYDEGAEPSYIWIDSDGYGEAWFTPGTTDINIYSFDQVYNAEHLGHTYNAYIQDLGNEQARSNTVTFSTLMFTTDVPTFAPAVTGASGGSLRQDEMYRATVSNEDDFDIMCIVLLDGGVETVDGHWVNIDHEAESTDMTVPLIRLTVNKEYTAKIYGLKFGYPLAYKSEPLSTIRVISPAGADEGSDILICNLESSYDTGDLILANVYYPNTEGLENILMEIGVSAPENASDPERWDFNRECWPETDGSLYYQPEVWDNPPSLWSAGDYVYQVNVWQEEDGQRIKVDGIRRTIHVTSRGEIDYDPEIPAYIDADELPYLLDFERPDTDFYYIGIENWDDHDWEADPDWNNTIAWFSNESDPHTPIEIAGVNQRVKIYIDAGKAGYNWCHREYMIPIIRFSGRVHIWTEDELAAAQPLPIHSYVPLWVEAPGAKWLSVEQDGDRFEYRDNPRELTGTIETGKDLKREGNNNFIVTAGFYDEDHDVWTEEQALLILEAFAEGDAGPFTASLDKNSITRGEAVTVTYTGSEHSNHYWVDLDVWNGDRNEWQWYTHLGDLNFEGANNGGSARMNTMELEPNIYRVRALAEGPGYFTSEYVITDSFAVQEAEIPASGILVNVSAEGNAVETCEEFELSAYAPGAAWMEVFWNYGDGDRNWKNDEGRDACSWRCAYSRSGEYQILVRAWYDEKDENGNQIWCIDENTGEIHTNENGEPDWPQQYPGEETVTMTVSADNGKLILTPPENLPGTIAPSDSEQTIEFSLFMPENAEYIRAEAWFEGVEDGGLCWQESWDQNLNVRFSFEPEVGQAIGVKLVAEARGYEGAELYYRIPVIPEDSSDLVVISLDPNHGSVTVDENGLPHAPFHSDVRFLVNAAEGHTLTAVKFYGMDGWWEDGREINHDNHGDWFEEDGSAFFHEGIHDDRRIGSTVQVFAMIRVDGGDTWYTSAPFQLYVDDYQVGPYDFQSREPVTVVLGENAVFTFTESEGANRYWVDAWNADDPDADSYQPDTSNTGTTVVLNTAQLHEGEFIIRGRAGIEGQDGLRESESEVRLIVTASSVQDGTVVLTVDKTSALTGEEVYASVFAPGADWVEIIRRQENGDEHDFANRGGSGAAGGFREDNAQTLLVFGRAHYFERDEHGDLIVEGQNEWGDDYYKELDWHESEAVEITISAPNGRIQQDSSGIPVSAKAGEDLTLTMNRPENADYLGWDLYLNRNYEDDRQEPDLRGDDILNLTIPGSDVILGNTIELRVWVGGLGYDNNHQNYTIPVINGTENRIRLTVSKNEVETNEDFIVTVTVNEPGVNSFQYNNGNGFWTHWDDEQGREVITELEPDQNHQWIHEHENYADSGIQTLYARAWINGEWVMSDPVRVTVTSTGQVGECSINLEKQTVARGETAVLHYDPAEHSDEERYDLHHDRNRSGDDEEHFVDYNLNWQRNPEENTITFSTAGMPEGEYWLSIWMPGERGYDSRQSGRVWLTVAASSVQDGAVVLTVDKTSALTGEQISASVFAPGADWVEIIRRQENGEEHDIANNGGFGTSGTFNENWAQTLQVFGRAHYFERDEHGEPIVEGQNEWGDIYKELDWHESETVEITISAPNGRIAQDASGIPVSAKAGEDLVLTMDRPENADYLGWELYLNRDYGNDWQEPDFRGNDVLNLTVPGNEVITGSIIELRVWVGGVGYDHNHQNYTIMVTDGEEERVRLAVSKNEVQTGENFTVTVTAEDASYIQYYNGNVFWTDWDDAQGQEVIRNLELDENHQWIHTEQNYDESGVKTLYARAWINDEWVMSEPVKVTVASIGQVGSFSINLEESEVIRGETAVLCYEEAEHAIEERYDLHHDRNRSGDDEEHFVDYHLHWQRDTEANKITFTTAEMPAGEYWLSIWTPGERGYESRESGRVWLTVKDPAEPDVSFTMPTKVETNEDISVGVYAPGAERMEIHWGMNDDTWDHYGESWSEIYSYNSAGTYYAFARAWYPAEDGQGERVVDSDTLTVTVTSNGQKVPLDLSDIPATLYPNESKTVSIPYPDGAKYMGWCLMDQYRNEIRRENNIDTPYAEIEIPGGEEGTCYYIGVWTGARNYEHNHQDVQIQIISEPEDSLALELDYDERLTCQPFEATVSFPAGVYNEIQFFDGYNLRGSEGIGEDATEQTFGFDFMLDGTYTLYARLWNGNEWVYTESKEVTVNAPYGELTFDASAIPARIYVGTDASFTLTKPSTPADVYLNYELVDRTEYNQLISWEELDKDGSITIPANAIIAGHEYELNYNVTAEGYRAVSDGRRITAYEEPTVTLSVDKKNVRFGETVTFTVIAPGATEAGVAPWLGDHAGEPLQGFTWTADEIGTFQFGARAVFDGFGEKFAEKTVSVTVRTLGEAPAPTVTVPDSGAEGSAFPVTVIPAEGGWFSISIYDGNGEPIQQKEHSFETTTLHVNDAYAGEYHVYVDYGKDGYDDGTRIEKVIPVTYTYTGPEWNWTDDNSAATAVFTSLREDDVQTVQASVSSTVTTEPTCDQTGVKTYTASATFQGTVYTDDPRTETLDKTAHDWDTPVFSWTETEDGYTATATFTCKNFEAHTRMENAAVTRFSHKDATCTEAEITVYQTTCEGFSEKKTVQGEAALGHTGTWEIVWNDDYSAYAKRTCDRCGRTETVDATVTQTVITQATCMARGEIQHTASVILDGTERTFTKKQYTPKTGHTPDEPEYTDEGLEMVYCSVCHELLSCGYPHAQHQWSTVSYDWANDNSSVTATRTCNATPAHPHSETVTVRTTAEVKKEPTCEEKGETLYTATFTQAGFTTQTKTVEAAAKGHQLVKHDAVTATCLAAGNSEYWACTREECGKYFSDENGENEIRKDSWIIPKLAHTLTAHGKVDSTCAAEGTEAYWECTACHKLFSDEGITEIETPVVIAKKAHTLMAHAKVDATCAAEGTEAYWECTACHKLFSDEGVTEIEAPVVIAKKAHTLTAHIKVDATCTADGTEAYWECGTCHKLFSDEGVTEIESPVVIAKKGHALTAHGAVAATCTTQGNSAYWTCTREGCGKYFSDENGENEIQEDSWINPKLDHDMTGHAAEEATCTTPGNSAYWYCSICKKYYKDEAGTEAYTEDNAWVINALGHKMTKHPAVSTATCTEPESSEYWSCDRCHKYFADEQGNTEIQEGSWVIGEALGHDWGEPQYEWSSDNKKCTAKRTCNNDQTHVETEEGTVKVQTTPATTEAAGKTVYTATFTNPAFTTQTKTVTIPKLEKPKPPVGPYTDKATGKYNIAADGTAAFVKPAAQKATITVPDSIKVNGIDVPVTAIADKAFSKDSKLTTINIGSNIKTIGKNAFSGCAKLKTVKGGGAVEVIKDSAFNGCVKLSKLPTFPKLVSIGGNAFKGCTALTKVTIGASVNSIGKSAFGGCKKLKTITIKSTLLTKKNVKSGAFKGIAANATVKCPKAKVKDYQKFLPGKGVPKTAKIK